MDDIHYLLYSQLPEDVNWYGSIYDNLFQVYGERMEDLYFNVVKGNINESLEDKWNTGNKFGNKYDYQYGYCHYFAYDIIGEIKKRFPNRKVNYLLLLANEVNDSEVEQEYLLHVYIKIDDMLLDSNGLTTMSKAEERMDDWYNRQLRMIPEDYEINMWTEESDEIPQIFFNNKFCNPGRVKKDVETFLSNPIVQRIFRDK